MAEMNAATVLVRPGDGFERFIRHCQRYLRLSPRAYPRGVFKFRTIEEAQAARTTARCCAELPTLDNRSEDEILDNDERGLPR